MTDPRVRHGPGGGRALGRPRADRALMRKAEPQPIGIAAPTVMRAAERLIRAAAPTSIARIARSAA